jgi:glutathione-specific gamma-glutamylcyclotransferase
MDEPAKGPVRQRPGHQDSRQADKQISRALLPSMRRAPTRRRIPLRPKDNGPISKCWPWTGKENPLNYRLRTQEELDASLGQALAAAPRDSARSGTWLLVYGSMLKEPPFTPEAQRHAVLEGWERVFCLADPKMRGTPQHPGLSLGLVRGPQCTGVAYRLAAHSLRDDLKGVWQREMVLPFYTACWLQAQTPQGPVPVLTFCTDLHGPLYEPSLSEAERLERLATCGGENGSNAAYLEETVQQLEEVGIPDARLAQLALRVRALRGLDAPPTPRR